MDEKKKEAKETIKLADELYNEKKYNEAISLYEKAFVLNKEDLIPIVQKARCLYYQEKFQDCIDYIENEGLKLCKVHNSGQEFCTRLHYVIAMALFRQAHGIGSMLQPHCKTHHNN